MFSTPDLADPQTSAFARFIAADSPTPLPSEQEVVVTAILAALNLGNLEATGALLADNVVRRIEPAPASETVTGKQALLEQARRGVAAHIHFEPSDFRVAGERVTFVHRWTSDANRARGIDFLVANSEVVVQGGKIVSITDTLTVESVAQLSAALARSGGPAGALASQTLTSPAQIPRQLPRTGYIPSLDVLVLGGLILAGVGLLLRRTRASTKKCATLARQGAG